jgi:gluconate kinase
LQIARFEVEIKGKKGERRAQRKGHFMDFLIICSMFLLLAHPTKRPKRCTNFLPKMQVEK